MHIQEESFSTNKLTEMGFLLRKIRVEALRVNHAVLHSGVQRGSRLVYSEEKSIVQAYFISFFNRIWHNYVDNGSFFCFYKSLAFPCVVLQFYISFAVDLLFFIFYFFCLPDSRDRSPGARGVLGLGDEV